MLRISVPKGWNEAPLKDVVIFSTDNLSENTSPDLSFRYVDIGSVEHGKGITKYQVMSFSHAPSRARKRVRKGDTIVSTVRTYLKAIAYVDDDEDLVVSTGFSVLRPKTMHPRFLTYLMESDFVCDEIDKLSWGVSYPAVSESLMGRIHVPVPPLPEQKRITKELDNELGKINEVSSILVHQLQDLEAYRASMIHEAVTKGLDPSVPMKPSDVEWIGDIPNNWSVNRLRYLASFESGATPSKDNLEFWEGTIPWVSSQEVKEDVLLDTSLHITAAAISSCSTRQLPEGTLVMVVRSGILQHTIPVALLGRPMTINQDIKAMRFDDEMHSKYFFYLVKGNNDNLLRELIKDKSTVDNISFEYLLSLHVPVPPFAEQISIVKYLDKRCATINAVIDTKRKQLDVLKKRRQSLIYEYVTGKRRVGKER